MRGWRVRSLRGTLVDRDVSRSIRGTMASSSAFGQRPVPMGRHMHVHNVYFWLKTDETNESFESGLRGLAQDPNVRASYFGRPADTHRDVVENSYTYGLVLVFDDISGHDAYQLGAAHEQFAEEHVESWTRVIVHDIDT